MGAFDGFSAGGRDEAATVAAAAGAASAPSDLPRLLPGVSAWEHHRRSDRYGNVIVALVLCLAGCAALLSDPWKGVGIVACVLAGWLVGWLQYREGRQVRPRLREERAAGYQTLGAVRRPDLPLLDARTGELIRPATARRPRGG